MAIQKEFIVRYREDGHVRFQIPQRATQTRTADRLTDAIAAIDGVQSVKLFRNTGKLSIRYEENRCRFLDLAKQLFQIIGELDHQGLFVKPTISDKAEKSGKGLKQRFKHSRVGRWFDAKLLAAKETAQAAKIIGTLSTKGPKALIKNPEKAVIDFLNDVLVLYLIKSHWPRITQQWLPKPLVYRYEWLATFYLFFLLVRSRRPK
jgi:hypothetical protein